MSTGGGGERGGKSLQKLDVLESFVQYGPQYIRFRDQVVTNFQNQPRDNRVNLVESFIEDRSLRMGQPETFI